MRVVHLDFHDAEGHEWHPEDPMDCEMWATVDVGDERGAASFQIHICTPLSIKRIDNQRQCFLIERYTGRADLISQLDRFIIEKTKGCTGDPYRALAHFWLWEYGRYDAREKFIDYY
jgi:Immunity protein 8